MAKILIINTPGLLNRGSMGIVIGALTCLERSFPNSHITFVCHHWDTDRESFKQISQRGQIQVKRHPWYRAHRSRITSLLHSVILALPYLFYCMLCTALIKLKLPLKTVYNDCDIIIDLNVDSINDCYDGGLFRPIFALLNMAIGIIACKPLVVWAASMVPLKNKMVESFAKVILNKAILITLREEASKDYVLSLGINKPNVQVTADLAFLLTPASTDQLAGILGDQRINDLQRPFVGITPALNDTFNREEFYNLMAGITDAIIRQLNATVIYIPHSFEISPSFGTKPRNHAIIEQIYKRTENKNRVRVIQGTPSSDKLKGVIGMCDIFISFMLHPLIASTSSLVPSIALVTYNPYKFDAVLSRMGQENCIIQINKSNTKDLQFLLLEKLDYVWANRDAIVRTLKDKSSLMKEQSIRNGDLLKEAYRQYSQ